MSQKWESVDQNTEISSGLQKLLDRDLTALSRFSTPDGTFPDEPFENMWSDNPRLNTVFKYDNGSWISLWEYTYGAPYNLKSMETHFQPLSQNLSNFGTPKFEYKDSFVFPTFKTKINTNFLACGSKSELKEYLSLGTLSEKDEISGTLVEENTIPMEKFKLDLNTQVERAMGTGDLKRSFSNKFDENRWCVADGRTLGSSVSVADLKGEKYKNLYLFLGGTESDWSIGKTINLPNFVGKLTECKEEVEEREVIYKTKASYKMKYEIASENYFDIRCQRDGKLFVEVVGGGGGAQNVVWKRKKHDRGAVGSGGGGGTVSAILNVKQGDILTGWVGAIRTPSIPNVSDEDRASVIYINDVKLIEGKAGKHATGPYNDPWIEFIGGEGGGTYVDTENEKIESYFESSGKAGAPLGFVGWGTPRNYEAKTVTGGSAGIGAKLEEKDGVYSLRGPSEVGSAGVCYLYSNGVSFNSLTDKIYYCGLGETSNFKNDPDRTKIIGAGAGWDNSGIARGTSYIYDGFYRNIMRGSVTIMDLTGCLEKTVHRPAVKFLFLIHL